MAQITRTWYLEIDSVPLATPAWEIPDVDGSWVSLFDSPDLRGQDRVIPFSDGARAYPRRPTVTVVTLPLNIYGDADQDGVAHPNQFEGMVANFDALKALIGAGAASDGTVTAIVHRGGLDALAASVTFLGFKGSSGFGDDHIRTTFDLSIPAGRFVVVSP